MKTETDVFIVARVANAYCSDQPLEWSTDDVICYVQWQFNSFLIILVEFVNYLDFLSRGHSIRTANNPIAPTTPGKDLLDAGYK